MFKTKSTASDCYYLSNYILLSNEHCLCDVLLNKTMFYFIIVLEKSQAPLQYTGLATLSLHLILKLV